MTFLQEQRLQKGEYEVKIECDELMSVFMTFRDAGLLLYKVDL